MANIKDKLNNIQNALFGHEVRGSIHDGIEAINNEVEDTTSRQHVLENTFEELTINAGNSNAEIVAARVEADGTTHKKLGDRLNKVDSQIKEKANESDLEVERKRIDNFTSLAEGSTTGDAELIDARIGADGVTYNNLGGAIRTQITELKEIINLSYENIYNKNKNIDGYYYDSSYNQVANSKWTITEKIAISQNDTVFYKGINHVGVSVRGVFFNGDEPINSFSILEGENYLTIPKNATFVTFSLYTATDIDTFRLYKNNKTLEKSQSVKRLGIIADSDYDNYSSYFDFNNIEPNTIITYNVSTREVSNKPITKTYCKGTLFTFSGRTEIKGGITQIFIDYDNNFYFRILFGDTTYKPWKKSTDEETIKRLIQDNIVEIQDNIVEIQDNIVKMQDNLVENDYIDISMFESIGIIGDSWASGYVYPNGKGTNKYALSWGQILARHYGISVTNFSKGGLRCDTWLNDARGLALLETETEKNLYIICLGINDTTAIDNGTINLGTIDDIDINYSDNNANSFYGYYGKIVSSILSKSSNAKIILCTIPRDSKPTYSIVNNAIIEIANKFGIPYIISFNDDYFKSNLFESTKVNAHPTAIGYSGMAKAYNRLISKCIIENKSYFIDYYGN